MSKRQNFTIIRESGKAEFRPDNDYLTILSIVGHEYMTAGSNWDRPNMLLLNGKVVVQEGLADIAWRYTQRSQQLYAEVKWKLRDEFSPDWLPQEGDDDADR